MNLSIQTEHPLFLNLLSNYLWEIGVYGRIGNIHIVKNIALVCKQWQAWVYSQEGPFSLVGRDIDIVRSKNYRCGPINKLNQLLMEQGKAWFLFVDKYSKNTETPLPINNLGINYVNERGFTPLKYAIDHALNNKTNLPCINTLIERGADPWLSIPVYFDMSKPHLHNHFVYVCNDRESEQHRKTSLEDLIESISKIGCDFIQADHQGENLFHHVRLFYNDVKRKSFYHWYASIGADINQLSNQKLTPLHVAMNAGMSWNFEIALDLIAEGARVDIPDPQGGLPLFRIIKEKDEYPTPISLLEAILKNSPSQAYSQDAQGCTPLWWAIRTGKPKFQDILLSHMVASSLENQTCYLVAFLNFLKDQLLGDWQELRHSIDGRDPVYIPLKHLSQSEEEILELIDAFDHLLSQLAPTEAQTQALLRTPLDSVGNTFYHYLASHHPPLLEHLLDKDTSLQAFLDTTKHKGETIRSSCDKMLNTLKLIKSCEEGDELAVTALLSQPVNVEIRDQRGNTLLHLVISRALKGPKSPEEMGKYYAILQLLLDRGLNPNASNNKMETPLRYLSYFYPSKSYDYPFKTLLIDSGAHPTEDK